MTPGVIYTHHVSDSEWKLLLVRQHHLVGMLPCGAEIYKITKIAILPLCQDEPKELELEVSVTTNLLQVCTVQRNPSCFGYKYGVRHDIKYAWGQFRQEENCFIKKCQITDFRLTLKGKER